MVAAGRAASKATDATNNSVFLGALHRVFTISILPGLGGAAVWLILAAVEIRDMARDDHRLLTVHTELLKTMYTVSDANAALYIRDLKLAGAQLDIDRLRERIVRAEADIKELFKAR